MRAFMMAVAAVIVFDGLGCFSSTPARLSGTDQFTVQFLVLLLKGSRYFKIHYLSSPRNPVRKELWYPYK
jgi:hypothetical protein